jgi:ubiquinone/menaquinone biosynthesis C-methylase UbiE
VTDFVTVKEVADILTEAMQVNNDDGETTQIEQEQVETTEWLEARETYMKDLGQIFQSMAHTEAVQRRKSIAKTMELVPTAKPLRQWIEENKDNPEFREKLGLR